MVASIEKKRALDRKSFLIFTKAYCTRILEFAECKVDELLIFVLRVIDDRDYFKLFCFALLCNTTAQKKLSRFFFLCDGKFKKMALKLSHVLCA
jgi:hypothetical protein